MTIIRYVVIVDIIIIMVMVMIMIMMMVVVIVNSEYQAQKCHHHDSCLTCVMLVSRRPAK